MTSRQVVVVGYDGAELVDIACVTTAFDLANWLGAAPPYAAVLATVDGGALRCESGLMLHAQKPLRSIGAADTVVVSGGRGHTAAAGDSELIRQVRRLAGTARRVASVCTGATTHWWFADELAAAYPLVEVDAAPIYIREGNVSTSGGVTASLDLTLAFLEEDHGPELARWVAMGMVTYLQRPGNQAQMSVFTTARSPDHATLRAVMDHVTAHPDADLTTAALAVHAGVSPRQLNRLFHDHLGEPPAAVVRRFRLELAARLVTSTDLPLSQVAKRCGFSSAEALRQAFTARYDVSPRAFRRTHSRAAGG